MGRSKQKFRKLSSLAQGKQSHRERLRLHGVLKGAIWRVKSDLPSVLLNSTSASGDIKLPALVSQMFAQYLIFRISDLDLPVEPIVNHM